MPKVTNHGKIDTASMISGVTRVIASNPVRISAHLLRVRARSTPPMVPSVVASSEAKTPEISEIFTASRIV